MADRPDKGKILLFDNDDSNSSNNRPERQGFGEIDKDTLARINAAPVNEDGCVRLEVGAWNRVSKGDKPYIFVSFDVENPKYAPKGDRPTGATHGGADDVPF
jgi:hypothetical protein